ncbi:MAG: AAA-like domain-containing protein, partial [Nodosilinea sp.]
MVNPSPYTVGGTVQANQAGLYLTRQADTELLQLCQQGSFAYVLTPRQMGKSSLMIRTAEQLMAAGTQAVIIDLTQIGTGVTADQWYIDFLDLVASQLYLSIDGRAWWQAQTAGNTLRLTRFFQEVVLAEVEEPVVIFVDEIDTTLSLDFTDDFYTAIRYLYVARANDSRLRRLSFVLIGVATPGDLIRDPKRTPFNIGQRVDLTDFTFEEALPLAAGLNLPETQARPSLEQVLAWTSGHPYLTQRLCQALTQNGPGPWSDPQVAAVVNQTFLGDRSDQDNNLQFVRDMLTKRAPHPLEQEVLTTYRAVYRGQPPVPDEEQNLVKSHLKLSGVVRRQGKALQVRNALYREVFNRRWIQDHLPENLWQRLKPALPLISVLLISLVTVSAVAAYALEQRRQAVELAQMAEKAAQLAEKAEREANQERQKTETALQEAKAALLRTQTAEREANQERQKTETALQEANRQRQRAEQQANIATTEQQRAQAQTRRAEEQTREAKTQTARA